MRRTIVCLLALVPALAFAETTQFGTTGSSSSGSDRAKLNAFSVSQSSTLEEFAVYVGSSSSQTMTFGIYERSSSSSTSWTRVWSDTLTVSGSASYRRVYPNWSMSAGDNLAVGVWFGNTATYYFTSSGSQPTVSWGSHQGFVNYTSTVAPTSFAASSGTGAYRMEFVVNTSSDDDFDGWYTPDDCDDADATTYPGAAELCDGVDNNCDGVLPLDEDDLDFDGFIACDGGDCDDSDPWTYAGAPEQCDGLDNDCDLDVDEDLTFDDDGDGYSSFASCGGSQDDCDDVDATINPAANEVCDFVDNNCNGDVDEGYGYDDDNDFGTDIECGGDDCDDEDPTTFTGANELCDGVDNDCDGVIPPTELEDNDADGVTGCEGDCDDEDAAVFPGQAEDCSNGIDDNCNGEVDEATDADGDGYGACDDCDDTNPNMNPGQTEDTCNGVDDDCDGELDPGEIDGDGDGFFGCQGDCDDANDLVFPDAEEVCDGFDNDCDGEFHPEEGEANDADGDGSPLCFDCDDEDPDVFPGAEEDECEAVDANCDGVVPEVDEDACEDEDGGSSRRRRGCDLGGGSAPAGLLLLGLVAIRRRS